MLNWLSYGVIGISKYVSPLIFAVAIAAWYFVVQKYIPIKKNYRLLIKVAAASCFGAGISPLLIIIFSGRFVSFLSSSMNTLQRINDWNAFQSILATLFKGFSITGGLLILVIVLLFVVKDAKKLIFGILYPFPLFAAIARINCFSEGCCFGKMWDGPFAVKYPPASHASKLHHLKHGLISRFEVSFPVHPVQLYIVITMFILFIILFIMNRYRVSRNIIAGTMLIGYGAINFIIEFLRVEPLLYNFLTMGQFMEIFIIILGCYTILKVKNCEIKES
jgi:prolipoprotein diacylglyceryltransferase